MGRPAWEQFGVTMLRDVKPFEEMKLRLLNGAHSSIAYLGLLAGHETVSAAFADPAIRRFIDALWAEAIPTLPAGAGLDPQSYIGELAKRFANPALVHRTAQIGNDGSQKLPQRIIGSALDRLAAGACADHLMLAVAAWIRAAEQRGDTLPPSHFTDPLDEPLGGIATRRLPGRETVEAVFYLTGFAKGSAHRDRLAGLAAAHLQILRKVGVAAALAALASGGIQK
jgi:fructuronate reductase